MAAEAPPSFSHFRFNAIGKNSLLSRLSGPLAQERTTSLDDEQGDNDDLYVDMDITSDEGGPADTQPNLLARLSDRAEASDLAKLSHDQVDGTPLEHVVTPTQVPGQTQVAFDITDQPMSWTNSSIMNFSESQGNGCTSPIAWGNTLPTGGITTSNISNGITLSPSSPVASPTLLEIPVSSGLPTPPPSSSTMPLESTASILIASTPLHPAVTGNSLLPPFPYAPLSELLQEERAAWSEVWITKRIQAGETCRDTNSAPLDKNYKSQPSPPGPAQQERSSTSSSLESRSGDCAQLPRSNHANAVTPISLSEAPLPAEISANTFTERSDPPGSQVAQTETETTDKMTRTSMSVPNGPHFTGKTAPSSSTILPDTRNRSAISPSCVRERRGSVSRTDDSQMLRSDSSVGGDVAYQEPAFNKTSVGLDIQVSTQSPSSDLTSPREGELKALLKSRSTSQGMEAKDSAQKNVTRSTRGSLSVESMPISPLNATHVNPRQDHRQSELSTDRPAQTASLKGPRLSLAEPLGDSPSVSEGTSALADIAQPAQAHGDGTFYSTPPHRSENALPTKRKISLPQCIEKDSIHDPKKQRMSSSRSLKNETDNYGGGMAQPVVGSDKPLSLPPKPSFEMNQALPPKPSPRVPTRTSQVATPPAVRKRSRSPGMKAEDSNTGNPVCTSRSRPTKRSKTGEVGVKPEVKREGGDTTIPEMVATIHSAVQHVSPHASTNMLPKVEEDVSTAECAPQAMISHDPDRRTQTITRHEETRGKMASCITPSWVHASLPKQQMSNNINESVEHSSTPKPVMDSHLQKQGLDQASRDSNPHSCKSSVEQQPGLLERISLQTQPTAQPTTLPNHDGEPTASHPQSVEQNVREVPERGSVPIASQCVPCNPSSTDSLEKPHRRISRNVVSRQSSLSSQSTPEDTPDSESDRRSSGGDVRQRGRPQDRQPLLVDHWSPSRPYSPIRPRANPFANTYRPVRPPSPVRLPRRTSVDGRRQYDGERTPPRYSWRTRGRPLSPRRIRSPSPRALPVVSRYGRSPPRPPRSYMRSPSPPPRCSSPRQERYLGAHLLPPRQHAERPRHAGSSDVRDWESRSLLREETAYVSHANSQSVRPHITADDRQYSTTEQTSVQGVASRTTVEGTHRRHSGLDRSEPGLGRFDGRVPIAERLATTNSNLCGVQSNTSSLKERMEGSYPALEDRGIDDVLSYQLSGGLLSAEASNRPHGDTGSSRGHNMPDADRPGDRSSSAIAASSSQIAPLPHPAELGPARLPSRLDLLDSRFNGLENQPVPYAGVQRYRYVDPDNCMNSNTINKDDKRDEPPHLQGDATANQREMDTSKYLLRRGSSRRGTSSDQNVPEILPPRSASVARATADSTPPPFLSKRQESTNSTEHTESHSSGSQNREQGVNNTQKPESASTRNLAGRIGDEASKSVLSRKQRDREPPRSVDSTGSRSFDLASRFGNAPEANEPRPMAHRLTETPTTSSTEPSLMSRLKGPPSVSNSRSTLPLRPSSPQRPPANNGNGRARPRSTSPRSNTSPTLLGRMRSPGREADRQREQQHVGRGGAGRGRGRGHGWGQGSAQGSLHAARHSKSSSKPSLEDRFS